MQDKRMTPEEIISWLEEKDYYLEPDDLRSSLRALLLHVGESLPTKRDIEPYTEELHSFMDERGRSLFLRGQASLEGYNRAIDDCKRVLDKIISEI